MSEEAKKEGEAAAVPKKSKKKLIIIAAAVVLLGGGGAGFALMGGKPAPDEHAAEEEHAHEAHLETIKLEPFIVNLSESTSFLKVTLLLEYNAAAIAGPSQSEAKNGAHGAGGGEGGKGPVIPPVFAEREPMLRDAIIKVLSSRKSVEVLSPDGKVKLKEDLIEAINESLGLEEPAVVNIYFTEFIIQ